MKKSRISLFLALLILLALLLTGLPASSTLALPNRNITLNPTTGHVGDRVEVTGQYWNQTSYYVLIFGLGTPNQRTVQTGSIGSSGIITTTFNVPAIPGGSYTIMLDGGGGETTTDTFRIDPLVTLNKSTGVMGDQVSISGSGFTANSTAALTFDGTQFATAPIDNTGSFAAVNFGIPESYQGTHLLKATDSVGNTGTGNFIVNQVLKIDPATGPVGTNIALSATGFAANAPITVTLAGGTVNPKPTPLLSNAKGSFSASFIIPAIPSGVQEIMAIDGTNQATKSFTVISALAISPTTGFVGMEVTVNGTGLLPATPINIVFDNDIVKTGYTSNYGQFSIRFTVPARNSGTYAIQVSDGTNALQANFTITTSANIDPQTSAASPGRVGTQVTIGGVGFLAGKTVTVNYDSAQVATATVNADGTFTATFSAPPSAAGTHTITATDGNNSKQFTFVMESTPPPVPLPVKPETGSRSSAQASFDWQGVSDPSGVTYTLQIASDANFNESSIVLEKTKIPQPQYALSTDEALEATGQSTPYYWHVKAVDGAGNESPWTGTGTFYVGFSLGNLSLGSPVIWVIVGVVVIVLLFIFGIWLGRRSAFR